jgi:hypothetical protein
MHQLIVLNDLFFPARKINNNSGNRVLGEPYSNSEQFYTLQRNDFRFVTYKEAVVGSLRWTQALFGALDIENLRVLSLEKGDAKEWFNAQIVQVDEDVKIDGESYYPYVNVQFSYNEPDLIFFDIGFNRFACSNKLIRPGNRLRSVRLNTKDLYEIPSWMNPCTIKNEVALFERQVRILKATRIEQNDIEEFIRRVQRRWGFPMYLIEKYLSEMGNTAYALLNILTDAASNNYDDERMVGNRNEVRGIPRPNDFYQSLFVRRQQMIGVFLDAFIREIQDKNEMSNSSEYIHSSEFKLNSESFNRLASEDRISPELRFSFQNSRLSTFFR